MILSENLFFQTPKRVSNRGLLSTSFVKLNFGAHGSSFFVASASTLLILKKRLVRGTSVTRLKSWIFRATVTELLASVDSLADGMAHDVSTSPCNKVESFGCFDFRDLL